MASRSLTDLRAVFAEPVMLWLGDCARAGEDILITTTYRSPAEQEELYKIGRTVKGQGVTAKYPMGKTVTNARAGQSAHQYGLALDFVPMQFGKPVWKDGPLWDQAIAFAKARGLESLRPMESAHLQAPNWKVLAGVGK